MRTTRLPDRALVTFEASEIRAGRLPRANTSTPHSVALASVAGLNKTDSLKNEKGSESPSRSAISACQYLNLRSTIELIAHDSSWVGTRPSNIRARPFKCWRLKVSPKYFVLTSPSTGSGNMSIYEVF